MKFDLILKGTDEFYPGLNNKLYYVLKVDNQEKIRWTIDLFEKFIIKAINSKVLCYLGIDFEFNKVGKINRDIALMQINLESEDSLNGYIIILYPPELADNDLMILKKLIAEPKIIKIFHGAESLDIPYVFSQLLISNELIEGLCTNFFDTKFLCDYAHISEKKKAKCSIYYLLTENTVITQEKFIELENIELVTGPIYTITINIHSMKYDVLRYCLYDVIYLPELIKKYISKGIVYGKIIPQTTTLMYKYRREVENEFSHLEKQIAQMNNYWIYDVNDKSIEITLYDIWECYFYYVSDSFGFMNNLREIQSLKRIFEVLTKMLIYSCVFELFQVQKSRQEKIYIQSNYFNKYFQWIGKYPDLNLLFQEYRDIVMKDLIKIANKQNITKSKML